MKAKRLIVIALCMILLTGAFPMSVKAQIYPDCLFGCKWLHTPATSSYYLFYVSGFPQYTMLQSIYWEEGFSPQDGWGCLWWHKEFNAFNPASLSIVEGPYWLDSGFWYDNLLDDMPYVYCDSSLQNSPYHSRFLTAMASSQRMAQTLFDPFIISVPGGGGGAGPAMLQPNPYPGIKQQSNPYPPMK